MNEREKEGGELSKYCSSFASLLLLLEIASFQPFGCTAGSLFFIRKAGLLQFETEYKTLYTEQKKIETIFWLIITCFVLRLNLEESSQRGHFCFLSPPHVAKWKVICILESDLFKNDLKVLWYGRKKSS